MSVFLEYPDRQALFAGLTRCVADELRGKLKTGPATLAVPGGATPGPFFEALRREEMDWKSVRVMLTDERFVPETAPRSNTRLLRDTLFRDRAAAAVLVPLYAEGNAPEDVLQGINNGVKGALPLTTCVLGMGEDMHTASLFPGADRLAEALSDDAPPVLPMRAEGAGEPRLTLTAPALLGAGFLHILITGQAKREAYARARSGGPVAEAPVRAILPRATVHWSA